MVTDPEESRNIGMALISTSFPDAPSQRGSFKHLRGPSSSAAPPGRRGQGGGLCGARRGELLGDAPAARSRRG